jgi:DNA-binding HxlR family transcriptional regulator
MKVRNAMTDTNSAPESDDGLSAKILRAAFDGVTDPADLQLRLGVGADELAANLDALVDAGFLECKTSRRNRSHRQYALVDRGECYRNVLCAFAGSAEGEKS